jgi:hemerythrin-like domain-containing protein
MRKTRIGLTPREFRLLAEVLERELDNNTEDLKNWERDLVELLKSHVEPEDPDVYTCDFCEKEFTDGYVSNAITSCRKCYTRMSNNNY